MAKTVIGKSAAGNNGFVLHSFTYMAIYISLGKMITLFKIERIGPSDLRS